MSDISCRGISFPFRIGNRGGVVMSGVDSVSAPHLEESIEQILLTFKGERVMEHHFGSDLDIDIFEPNESATHNLIKFQIKEALEKYEPRITVESISLSQVDEEVNVEITYTVKEYNSTQTYTTTLGGGSDEN